MKKIFFLILGAVLFLGAIPSVLASSALPSSFNPSGELPGMRDKWIGDHSEGRSYSGFGTAAGAKLKGGSDCRVIRVGTLGFPGSIECSKESVNPSEEFSRAEMIVPYAFFTRRHRTIIGEAHQPGRSYIGFGEEEEKEVSNSLPIPSGGFLALGVKKNKPQEDFDQKKIVRQEAEPVQKNEGPSTSDPLNPEASGNPEGNISDTVLETFSSDPDLVLDVHGIERHFFSGGGARGLDGTVEPYGPLRQGSE